MTPSHSNATQPVVSSTAQSDAQLLLLLLQGDHHALENLYCQYRLPFLKWAGKQFGLDYNQAIDIYQDAIIVLSENVRKGRLTGLHSSLKTYLFAIGKNQILSMFRQKQREQESWQRWQHDSQEADGQQSLPPHEDWHEIVLQSVVESLHLLPMRGQRLLELYYFQKVSLKEISREMGYKNEDVVKSTKLRCLDNLRKVVQQKVTKQAW